MSTNLSRLLLLAVLLCVANISHAAWGLFQSYAILDYNTGNTYRAGGLNADGGAPYNDFYYGFFKPGDTFVLNGGQIKTFKNGGDDVCGGAINYRIYRAFETPTAAFTPIVLNFNSDIGGGDQVWETAGANVDLLAGLTAGDYVLEVYWEAYGGNCGMPATQFDSDFGNNFKAFFSVGTEGFQDATVLGTDWTGDVANFQVGDPAMAGAGSNANIGVGNNQNDAVLFTNGDASTVLKESFQSQGIWQFSLATGDGFSTSSLNKLGVILMADDTDVLNVNAVNPDFVGYWLRFGDNGAMDTFKLIRQTGTTSTVILNCTGPALPDLLAGQTVRVVRSTAGLWSVFADAGFDNITPTTLIGQVVDVAHNISLSFGVSADTGTGNASRVVYFDNLFTQMVLSEVAVVDQMVRVTEPAADTTFDIEIAVTNPDATAAITGELVLVSGDAALIGGGTNFAFTVPAGATSALVSIPLTGSNGSTDCTGFQSLTFELQNLGAPVGTQLGNTTTAVLWEDNQLASNTAFSDDFEDQDISDWLNNEAFEVAAIGGQLNGFFAQDTVMIPGQIVAQEYMSQDLSGTELSGASTIWRANVRYGIDPTPGNNFSLVLTSSDENPFAPTATGYAVGTNFGTADDTLRLVKFDSGVFTNIIGTNLDWSDTENFDWTAGLEVVRDAAGNWTLNYQLGGNFDNMIHSETVADLTYNQIDFLALANDHNTTGDGDLRVDDVSVVQKECAVHYYSVDSGNYSGAIWNTNAAETAANGVAISAGPFTDLTVQDGHTVGLDQDFTAKTFNIAATGTTVDAGNTATLYGDWNNLGDYQANGGTTLLRGGDAQAFSGVRTNFTNLTLQKDAGSTSTAAAEIGIAGVLTLADGELDANGNLILISDVNGTAAVAPIQDGTITGNVTVERYLPATIVGSGSWINLAAPVQATTLQDWEDELTTAGYPGSEFPAYPLASIQTYNESLAGNLNQSFIPATGNTDVLDGYSGRMVLEADVAKTIDATGALITGDVNLPLSYTTNTALTDDGWNLLANPYACGIDGDALALASNMSFGSYYIYDGDQNTYLVYTNGMITPPGDADISTIGSGQGFFVKVDEIGGEVNYAEDMKVTGVADSFERTGENNRCQLHFKLESDLATTSAAVAFFDAATADYFNMHDAISLSYYSGSPAISTASTEDLQLTYHGFSNFDNANTLPLHISAPYADTYTLSIAHVLNLPEDVCAWIEDTETGETIAMEAGNAVWNFTVTEDQAPFESDRFVLHTTPSLQSATTDVTCFGLENGFAQISAPSSGMWTYEWIDAMGNVLFTETNTTGGSQLSDLPADVYQVAISSTEVVCGSLYQTFDVQQPLAEQADIAYELAACNLDGEGQIVFELENADAYEYEITFEGATAGMGWTDEQISLIELDPGVYTISLASACTSYEETIDLTDPFAVELAVSASTNEVNLYEEIGTVEFTADAPTAENIWWNVNGQLSGEGAVFVYTFENPGGYVVEVIAEGYEGCEARTVEFISVDFAENIAAVQDVFEVKLLQGNGQFILDFQDKIYTGNIEMYNAAGQRVLAQNINGATGKITVEIAEFAHGIYQLRMTDTDGNSQTGTVIR